MLNQNLEFESMEKGLKIKAVSQNIAVVSGCIDDVQLWSYLMANSVRSVNGSLKVLRYGKPERAVPLRDFLETKEVQAGACVVIEAAEKPLKADYVKICKKAQKYNTKLHFIIGIV